jgi:hypothetical protein
MKIALFLTAIAGASAFAPVNQPTRASSQLNAGLDGIRGVGPETAGKIVSKVYNCSTLEAVDTGLA